LDIIMAEMTFSASPDAFASPFIEVPPAALMRILSRFERSQLAGFVEVAIGLLDVAEPDPDEPDFSPRSDGLPGDPSDHEPTGDEEGGAYIEWHAMRGSQKRGPNLIARLEDDEDDDQDTCLAADDQGTAGGRWFDTDGLPGDDADAEDGHDREDAR
jgi:hypothetical protein